MKLNLFDRSRIPLLEKELDAFVVRNKAIANNIANIGTPGYKRVDVSFRQELANAIESSRNDVSLSENVENIDPSVEVDRSGSMVSGANNVDIDQEMAELAKNQLEFKLAANLMSQTFNLIDKSVNGQGTA